jgi:hypothetical protein
VTADPVMQLRDQRRTRSRCAALQPHNPNAVYLEAEGALDGIPVDAALASVTACLDRGPVEGVTPVSGGASAPAPERWTLFGEESRPAGAAPGERSRR